MEKILSAQPERAVLATDSIELLAMAFGLAVYRVEKLKDLASCDMRTLAQEMQLRDILFRDLLAKSP